MKAIVYSTKKVEKEILLGANNGKHELTLTHSPLSGNTAIMASGHEAVIIFTNDEASCSIIAKLASLGVKYIATRSVGTDQIDLASAVKHSIKVANVPGYSPHAVAEHALALTLALSRHLILSNHNCHKYDFSLDKLTGFNLYGKTVGLLGLGHIGKATARIFNGFGCKVLGYDIDPSIELQDIQYTEMEELLKQSDIISLHLPLTDTTRYLVNTDTIGKMKNGVMLINTARGGLVKTTDIIQALNTGKIGYYGTDVYEYERGLFFEDHEVDQVRDALLNQLMNHPNALVTPHQAFLTIEAMHEIAAQTIRNLDDWEKITK